jgi:seryl-tRNA synthetase
MSEMESEHVSLMARLQSLWERQVEASVEVKQARLNLKFHRRKVNKLSEESGNAESWEKVLEAKCYRLEEELKPSLLRFSNRLEVTLASGKTTFITIYAAIPARREVSR